MSVLNFLGEEELIKIFFKEDPSNSCYKKLRSGLKAVGIYQVRKSYFSKTLSFFFCIGKLYNLIVKHFSSRNFFRRKLVFLKLFCDFTR